VTTVVEVAFDICNTEVDFIWKGCTWILQLVDVGIIKFDKGFVTVGQKPGQVEMLRF
jgi:hypothetical protein